MAVFLIVLILLFGVGFVTGLLKGIIAVLAFIIIAVFGGYFLFFRIPNFLRKIDFSGGISTDERQKRLQAEIEERKKYKVGEIIVFVIAAILIVLGVVLDSMK